VGGGGGEVHLDSYNKLKTDVITASVVNVLTKIVAQDTDTIHKLLYMVWCINLDCTLYGHESVAVHFLSKNLCLSILLAVVSILVS